MCRLKHLARQLLCPDLPPAGVGPSIACLMRTAVTLKKCRVLRAATFLFSLLRIVMQVGLPKQALKFFLVSDLPAQVLTTLPELLILDLQWGAPLLGYYLCHAGSSAFFYFTMEVHCLITSILWGFGTHTLGLCAFLAFHHGRTLLCFLGGLHAEDLHEATKQEQPPGQQPEAQKQEQPPGQQPEAQKQEQPPGQQPEAQKQEQPPGQQPEAQKQEQPPGQQPEAQKQEQEQKQVLWQQQGQQQQAQPPKELQHSTQQEGKERVRVDKQLSDGLTACTSLASSVSTDSIISRSNSTIQGSIYSGNSSIKNISRSSTNNSSHKALSAMGVASPRAKVVVTDALARDDGRQRYVSKLHKPHRSDSAAIMQYVQAACRFAVKVNGPSLPENLPCCAASRLQQRLSRYQRLMPEAPAVRAGCLVISYSALPQQSSLQDMSKEARMEASLWAEENGLLSAEESRLIVQACCQSSWCSSYALPGQPFPPEHSLILHEPFIEACPPNLEKEWSCTFDLTLIAPAGCDLRGWHGAADAPEDLPEQGGVKRCSLCLLATLDGHFVHVSVEQRSQGSLGECPVQVQVRLPEHMFDASSPHPRVLVLELWAAGSLVCSYSAPTVPSAGTLKEMHDWVDQAGSSAIEESSAFMRDLVVWMHCQANIDTLASADDDESQQQLALLAALGLDLLGHSLRNGMPALAGLLLNGLISTAPYTPRSDHPDPQAPAAEERDAPEDIQTHPSGAPIPDAHPTEQSPRESAPLRGASHKSKPPIFARVLQSLIRRPAAPAAPSNCSSPAASTPAASTSSSFAATSSSTSAGNMQARGPASSMLSEEASSEEAAFRAWTIAHVSGLSRAWCSLHVLLMSLSVLRAWTEGQKPLLELSSYNGMLLGYTLGALFIRPGRSNTEVILAAITVARAAFCIMIGTGLSPMSFTLSLVFKCRTEVFVEVFMMSVMERVRLTWAVPLRALLTLGFTLMYRRIGSLPWPLAQSALVNLCALGVTAAMEWRDRRLFRSSRMRAKQQAFVNEGVGQHAVLSTPGKQKSC